LQRPEFLIPAPDAPWIECVIVEVSDEGFAFAGGTENIRLGLYSQRRDLSRLPVELAAMGNAWARASCRQRS